MALDVDIDALTGPHPSIHRFDKQLTVMLDVMFKEALRDDATPTEKAACVRAWDALCERKRIRAGLLKPGSINARDDSRAKLNKPKVKRVNRGPVAGPTNHQAAPIQPLEATPKESLSQDEPSPHPPPGGGQPAGDGEA